MFSGAVPSLVEPPMRLRICALEYASELNADGEKADGENAEGEKAEGENADGENADGLKAEGEKAEGENADGLKADGEKAEGENADGLKADGEKADGAEFAPPSSALNCSSSSSESTLLSTAAMSLKTNMS